MAFELEGKLIVINPTQEITATFKKREFVIETKQANGDREFIDYIKFQIMQNKCDLLDAFVVGQDVKVSFNVKGNKFEKEGNTNYFTNLNCWKIEGSNQAPQDTPVQSVSDQNNDDLPF